MKFHICKCWGIHCENETWRKDKQASMWYNLPWRRILRTAWVLRKQINSRFIACYCVLSIKSQWLQTSFKEHLRHEYFFYIKYNVWFGCIRMPFKNWDKQSERWGHNEVTTVEVTHKLTRIGKKVPAGWRQQDDVFFTFETVRIGQRTAERSQLPFTFQLLLTAKNL